MTSQPTFEKVFGYQGDNLNLPVPDVASALPFYQSVLGFTIESRGDGPPKRAVLSRGAVRMAIAENGGDPTQDGCAFHVTQLETLFEEFKARGLGKDSPDYGLETHGGNRFKVFYVVAPDGLCFWFGERQFDATPDGKLSDLEDARLRGLCDDGAEEAAARPTK